MPIDDSSLPELRERFYGEMRVLADLHHPNIVTAYDAGELPPFGTGQPGLIYLVLELVSGGDLEDYVLEHGPLPVAQACDWARQAAAGLQEAHDNHLVHRDVKPSNLLRTEQGQVKLVDFGLVRQFASQITDRRVPSAVSSSWPRAEPRPGRRHGRGGHLRPSATLFWLLTGEPPYPMTR
jgi:serine/threonine-protein kinase